MEQQSPDRQRFEIEQSVKVGANLSGVNLAGATVRWRMATSPGGPALVSKVTGAGVELTGPASFDVLLVPADTAGKRIALGMLWGWMPCGLSTTLLAAAWLQASAAHGALTMAAFGLGTLPMMVPLTWAGARFGQRLQRGPWRTGAGLLVIGSGVLTIAAPWLMRLPALHGVLEALGCRSLPV